MKRHHPFKPGGLSFRYAFATDLMTAEDRKAARKAVSKITGIVDAQALVHEDIEKAEDKKKEYRQVWSLVFPVASKEFATLQYKGIPVCVFYARRIVTEHVDVLVPIRESAQVHPNAWIVIPLLGKESGVVTELKERLKAEEKRNADLDKALDRLQAVINSLESDSVLLKKRMQEAAVMVLVPDDDVLDVLASVKFHRLLGVHTFTPRVGLKPKPDECRIVDKFLSHKPSGTVAAVRRPGLASEDDVLVAAEVIVFSELKKSSRKSKGKKHAKGPTS